MGGKFIIYHSLAIKYLNFGWVHLAMIKQINVNKQNLHIINPLHVLYISLKYSPTYVEKVWFEVEDPDGCKEAPEEVNTGELPTDMCGEVGNVLNFAHAY